MTNCGAGVCLGDDTCGCDVSGAADGSAVLFLVFAFAFVLRRRLDVRF